MQTRRFRRTLTAIIFGSATLLMLSFLTADPAWAQGCAQVPDGLVSWWPGEGDSSDLVGGNPGTLAGATTFASGEVGQAFKFGGFQDAVTVGNPANLQLQSFTIEAWIARAATIKATLDPLAPNGVLFGYGLHGSALGLFDDGRLILTKVGVSFVDSGALRVTDLNFHHVAVTKSGSTVMFYVDGVAQMAPDYDPGFEFTTNAAIAASGDKLSVSFLGVIDELSIYDRAITGAELQTIVDAGSFGKCQPG